MTKSALFLDFDGLKFDTLSAHVTYLNERYGINSCAADYTNNPPLDQIIEKYLPKELRPTREEIYEDLGKNFISSLERHQCIAPMTDMPEVLRLLAEKYELWTVTARQKGSLYVIRYLLDKYVPNCITGIHCVWEHLGDKRFLGVSKREFILGFNGPKTAFLDDSADEILEVQDLLPSYLFDPAGLNDHRTEIEHRVRSWKEIGELFL